MKTFQKSILYAGEISTLDIPFKPDLLLLFVSPQFEDIDLAIKQLQQNYPHSILFGCSTSGEILNNEVKDQSIALTAIRFEKTIVACKRVDLNDYQNNSEKAGIALFDALLKKDLKHILVISDGLRVNGAELVHGLQLQNIDGISITGGLAGDGDRFEKTFVIDSDGAHENKIIGLGFYGHNLKVHFGSKGGWDSFGLERKVTRAEKNVLYEVDDQPALELYKKFLGDKAKELPGSALLFPLSVRVSLDEDPLVRTILAVNEEDKSMTFAGNIPQGAFVRMMKANIDRLIDGAEQSALLCANQGDMEHGLSILISCVGRRLVLKQLVEEEVEAVTQVLSPTNATTGFYSYGEIAPFDDFSPCALHNQTMTITTLSE